MKITGSKSERVITRLYLSVGEEFSLHADLCNLGSGFLANDSMSFVQIPGTQGQNMRTNRFSNIYRSLV